MNNREILQNFYEVFEKKPKVLCALDDLMNKGICCFLWDDGLCLEWSFREFAFDGVGDENLFAVSASRVSRGCPWESFRSLSRSVRLLIFAKKQCLSGRASLLFCRHVPPRFSTAWTLRVFA